MPAPDLRDLDLYADTDKQRLYLDTANRLGNVLAASRELGISIRTLRGVFSRLRERRDAAEMGAEMPDSRYILPGQKIAGVSTLAKTQDGNLQWIKTKEDREAVEREIDELREALTDSLPREKAVKPSKVSKNEDLLNLHILTDFHLGMYAWGEEAGEDWDMKIAEDLLVSWFQYAIKTAPPASVGVLAQLGDMIHIDGLEPLTPASKHLLDSDTRFQKIIRIAIRALRRIIRMMLKKYESVHIIMADANHDPASSAWMREVFHAFYEDEPRVTVDRSPSTYYCYEHGETSLFFHHGHKRRPNNIDDVFTAKFREVFGRTSQSYAHMGHLHHKEAKETNLMIVEQHRTMAASDAYGARGGWLSGRSASVITYHKKYGDVGRFEVNPKMLE